MRVDVLSGKIKVEAYGDYRVDLGHHGVACVPIKHKNTLKKGDPLEVVVILNNHNGVESPVNIAGALKNGKLYYSNLKKIKSDKRYPESIVEKIRKVLYK